MKYEFEERVYLGNTREVQSFFEGKKRVLLILGCGFDPRMNEGVKVLQEAGTEFQVLVIHYGRNNNSRSKKNNSQAQKNLDELRNLVGMQSILEVDIQRYSLEGEKRDVTFLNIRNGIQKQMIQNYERIILDISAMPRTVSFYLIKHIYNIRADRQKVYILVCENSVFDDKIDEISARDSANYMYFNLFTAGSESVNDSITVWLPVMGDHEMAAFRKIAEYVKPDEICPVIPFPSRNVRRGEKIIRSYGHYLFKELKIEKRNIIYVPENHPLLIYQKLCSTINFYEHALQSRDEEIVKYVFSSQSSKLMDVGIVLALLDLNKDGLVVTMAYVDNDGYNHPNVYESDNNQLSCVCMDDKEFCW